MFMLTRMQDSSAFADVLQNLFISNFITRRNEENAALFTAAGDLRIIALEDGDEMDSATGRAGVESLMRSIHENVAVSQFRTTGLCRTSQGVDCEWSASIRNWGFGPERRARGRLRLNFAGMSIARADFHVETALWRDLVRPEPFISCDATAQGHASGIEV